jgi:catechol 2,3-dioxygenase
MFNSFLDSSGLLHSLKTIGTVDLYVKDIQRVTAFYHELVGLDILNKTDSSVSLGNNNQLLLRLHKKNNLPTDNPTQAGLYHVAYVFSFQSSLAKTISRILTYSPQSYTGSADHLVSEAFYFSDPEGNGVELYVDRDRSQWQWENNHVKMASIYIDPSEYIQRHSLTENHTYMNIGHIHLRVGDIPQAKKFYVDIVGFTITSEILGALFISVNGYHHHIGLNTWESFGAGKRTESLGLKEFSLPIIDKQEREQLLNRCEKKHISVQQFPTYSSIADPWGTEITIPHI